MLPAPAKRKKTLSDEIAQLENHINNEAMARERRMRDLYQELGRLKQRLESL